MGDIKDIIRKVIREEFINELSKNDVHVKEIMKFYDKGTYSTKKAVSIFVSGKTNASRNQILDDLGDMGYNDAWEVMDHFKLKIESVNETTLNEGFGDSIKKIKSLAIKMASTKYDRAKSHLNIDKIASADKFDGSDAMNKATSALLQQNDLDEDLKSTINNLAVKLGTGATMMGIITALVSMSGWIQYLDSSFTKWYYTEIQKLAEPEVMKVMQDLGSAGQAEGSIYGKLGMYAFFIFFTIAVISLVAARMTQKPKNEYVDDKGVEHVAAALPQTEEEPVTESLSSDIKNAKNRLKDPHTITDIQYKKTSRGDKYIQINYKKNYVAGKMYDPEGQFVSIFYGDDKDLVLIGKELKLKLKESVNEGKYYIGYNKGRGQGTGVFKDVFSTYKDARKELEKIEKQRGGSYNQIAYYVADEKGNFVREVMLGEGRGIKSIQNDLDKTVVAIESEIASYKATKGTPQEKKHIDNLKKLHPIKKKLQSELDMVVSGLYRDAELKIED